ncbi:MAG: c-type cytochrome [Burkholderiales bacterium]|nr:c-type cytochrome [Burkholderiales bacterium]
MRAILISALLALASPFAHAAGDAGAGAQKAKPCAACHGADFSTPISADIPLLAGQYEDYLARALADYKSGARKNPIMGGQAGALSPQDILDLAAYFAGLPGKLKVIPLHRLVQ